MDRRDYAGAAARIARESLVIAMACMAMVLPMSLAAQPALSVADFQHTTWGAQDGFLADTWAIAQTGDGWLWFGGPNGLTRFDGLKAEVVDVASTDRKLSRGVRVLYATRSGALLIGHSSGGVSILQAGTFTRFDDDATRRSALVNNFTEDADGTVWAAVRNGLMRFDGTHWQQVGAEWGFPAGNGFGVVADSLGTLWVTSGDRVVKLARGSRRFEAVSVPVNDFADLIQAPDGRVWFVGTDSARMLPEQQKSSPRAASVNARASATALFDDRGVFWWLDESGISLPAPSVRAASLGAPKTVLEDREGNIWVGTQSATVHRLKRPDIVKLANSPVQNDLTPWTSFAVDASDRIWMVMSNGIFTSANSGLWSLSAGKAVRVQPDQLSASTVLRRDRQGRIWAGGSDGIWRLEGERFVKAFDLPASAQRERLTGLSANCAGGTWVDMLGAGLQRYDGTAWKVNGGVDGLPAGPPTAQECDPSGRLWLGYGDGTVATVQDGRSTRLAMAAASDLGFIHAIHVGRFTLIAGERGLAVLAGGTVLKLETATGAFEGVSSILEARDGDVWLNGVRGLTHLAAAELDRAVSTRTAGVTAQLFDDSDGYPAPAFAALGIGLDTLVQAADGRIWLAGHGGLAWIDPSKGSRPARPSPLVIRSLTAEGREYATTGEVRLPAGTHTLDIGYTALNLSHAARMRFRYRLEGSDLAWVDAESRRRAFYTNMRPGTYRFRVNVSDEDGTWSPGTATLDVVIPPTFVESRIFLALCVALAVGLLALAYRIRVRQLEGRQRSLVEARLHERERIARELHDTLLQGIQALILRVDAVARAIPDDAPRAQLNEALTRAEESLTEGRDRIHDLRSNLDASDDLAEALSRAAAELAGPGSAEFRVLDEGHRRPLDPVVAEASFLVAREALANAFRHANARSIEVEVAYGASEFCVRVRDDGQGIAPQSLEAMSTPGHWGLRGMTERSQKAGGKLSMWTRPGAGLEIELTFPAAVAYREVARRTLWAGRLRWPPWVSGT